MCVYVCTSAYVCACWKLQCASRAGAELVATHEYENDEERLTEALRELGSLSTDDRMRRSLVVRSSPRRCDRILRRRREGGG